jgi:GNAT superfamily N-acetyltransferase
VTGFRIEPRPSDVAAVRSLVAATGVFRDSEVAIAAELVEEALARGADASGYRFLLADDSSGRLLGYACYGPIAGTVHSFDLYWIAVDPARQRRGLGRRLMAGVEAAVRAAGGRRLYVDTSTSEAYAPTRAFYLRCGHHLAAELPDFYAPGDGKAVFCKVLVP